MTVYNNNICWYPLGYNSRYYNFNRRHQQEYRRQQASAAADAGDADAHA